MDQSKSNIPTQPQQPGFFLSELVGARVTMDGKKVGKLNDVIIKENGALPVVTNIFINRPFGESAVIPWDCVQSLTPREIVLVPKDLSKFENEPAETAILLRDYILDKKAIDLDGREMEVVYDIKLTQKGGKLYVSEVDLSHYGLLRRMGLTWLANLIYNLAESIREQTISWTLIQPLPEDLSRFRGDLKFNILKEKLADMHPVDLADILEEMDPDQRVEIFKTLDTETASDTLEEIEPAVQRDLVEALDVKKIARLIDEMTTGQAADVLSILSGQAAADILEHLEPENALKIKAIMEQQEENILNFATQEYVSFPPDTTVEYTLDHFRFAAEGKDEATYVHIIDGSGQLLGVLDIEELLQAEPAALLKDVMIADPITLDPDSSLKEAAQIFSRYGFRAIPITDEQDKLLGVVSYRDIMKLKHRFIE